MASEAVSDRGMWDLNPKVEGAKQEETPERQRFFRQIGTCGSRRNTVVGSGLDQKMVIHKEQDRGGDKENVKKCRGEENPKWCRNL